MPPVPLLLAVHGGHLVLWDNMSFPEGGNMLAALLEEGRVGENQVGLQNQVGLKQWGGKPPTGVYPNTHGPHPRLQ